MNTKPAVRFFASSLLVSVLTGFGSTKSFAETEALYFQIPSIGQNDPAYFKNSALIKESEWLGNVRSEVSLLTSAATSYAMLERARFGGAANAMVDDFFIAKKLRAKNSPRIKVPPYVGDEEAVNVAVLIEDLRAGRPVLLKIPGDVRPEYERVFLIVGFVRGENVFSLITNYVRPGGKLTRINLELNGDRASLPVAFSSMRRVRDYRLKPEISRGEVPSEWMPKAVVPPTAANPPPELGSQSSTKVRLTLRDGTVFVGTTSLSTVSIKSAVGVLNIKLSDVRRLEPGTIELMDGNVFKGEIDVTDVPIQAAGASLHVGFAQLAKLEATTNAAPAETPPAAAVKEPPPSVPQSDNALKESVIKPQLSKWIIDGQYHIQGPGYSGQMWLAPLEISVLGVSVEGSTMIVKAKVWAKATRFDAPLTSRDLFERYPLGDTFTFQKFDTGWLLVTPVSNLYFDSLRYRETR